MTSSPGATAAAAAAAAVADVVSDALGSAASSPLNMMMVAILVGSAVHLIVSLLITLKNVGMRAYLVIQLAGLWYILPPSARVELYEHLKTQASFASTCLYAAGDAAARLLSAATAATTEAANVATTTKCEQHAPWHVLCIE